MESEYRLASLLEMLSLWHKEALYEINSNLILMFNNLASLSYWRAPKMKRKCEFVLFFLENKITAYMD